ncbi:uncharacterized protein B0I36DRAFT_350796 [Microdochium trichocladiopsis]|uniref:Uncharacterized protein n=1 Tax=Microdochium trichocladiopsis TaxID=1682393 RepID=A0A9P9BKN5_9PEZI|nr:uncharacterized protein B0I36DRAFT_350796 [Microdochium trichocladiopsis]KAH7027232.1 hypothetical protein B0I36DRAFT_350796 [Microdochium trichocladiopsis]
MGILATERKKRLTWTEHPATVQSSHNSSKQQALIQDHPAISVLVWQTYHGQGYVKDPASRTRVEKIVQTTYEFDLSVAIIETLILFVSTEIRAHVLKGISSMEHTFSGWMRDLRPQGRSLVSNDSVGGFRPTGEDDSWCDPGAEKPLSDLPPSKRFVSTPASPEFPDAVPALVTLYQVLEASGILEVGTWCTQGSSPAPASQQATDKY